MTVDIHQVLVGAARGDAITNLALEIRDRLRRTAPSEIYAYHVDDAVRGDVEPLSSFPAASRAPAMIVYHSSIGEPKVTEFLLSRREQLVLVYHNITPFEYYLGVDAHFSSLLAWGRSEIGILRPRVDLAFADSAFNARELLDIGYQDPLVLPLGVRPDRLIDLPGDADAIRAIDSLAKPIVLAVGQQLPHKRFEHLIEAMHVLRLYRGRGAALVIVGRPHQERYHDSLVGLATRLMLPDVVFTGALSDAALASYYRRAAVYVSASLHEGLGIPALEAMAFGVPVVARTAGAVGESVADGGIVLPPTAGPTHFAEALDMILGDSALSARLARAALQQAGTWDADAALEQFEQALLGIS